MEAPPMRQMHSELTDALLGYIHQHYADITIRQVAEEMRKIIDQG